jgi:hypothetical protein
MDGKVAVKARVGCGGTAVVGKRKGVKLGVRVKVGRGVKVGVTVAILGVTPRMSERNVLPSLRVTRRR